jgi:hypothetical protein
MELLQGMYEVALIEKAKCATDDILDINRRVIEPYVYMYLQQQYGPMLQDHWKTYLPPKQSEHVFVIAERRAHPYFPFILQNMAWAGPHMAVYIFCSEENQGFIRSILGDKASHYHIIPVFNGNPDREHGKRAYNNLLTDYRFYQLIDATYMLTIQLDNIIRKKIDPAMFVGEYWGNPWSWSTESAGGGGATVRNIPAMIRICQLHRSNPDMPFEETEDKWLSDHVTDYPDLSFRASYLMESVHVQDPCIVHQFWTFAHCYTELPREQFIALWDTIMRIS